MSFTSILVYVEDLDSADSRALLACAMVEIFDARLIERLWSYSRQSGHPA
jgi:hypothetical protein